MKTLVLTDSTGMHVELLTDLIGSNKEFTIYQVEEVVAGVRQIGLSDTTIQKGITYDVDDYNLDTVIADCELHDYTLVVYETGMDPVTLYEPVYYGGAIGEDDI